MGVDVSVPSNTLPDAITNKIAETYYPKKESPTITEPRASSKLQKQVQPVRSRCGSVRVKTRCCVRFNQSRPPAPYSARSPAAVPDAKRARIVKIVPPAAAPASPQTAAAPRQAKLLFKKRSKVNSARWSLSQLRLKMKLFDPKCRRRQQRPSQPYLHGGASTWSDSIIEFRASKSRGQSLFLQSPYPASKTPQVLVREDSGPIRRRQPERKPKYTFCLPAPRSEVFCSGPQNTPQEDVAWHAATRVTTAGRSSIHAAVGPTAWPITPTIKQSRQIEPIRLIEGSTVSSSAEGRGQGEGCGLCLF